jgi:hypothetical protein
MQLFFPHWQTHDPAVSQGLAGTTGMPFHQTPFAGQQQQQQQHHQHHQQQQQPQQVLIHNSSPFPIAGGASELAGVAIRSPFAGIDASILRQPEAPAAALPAAAQYAAPRAAAYSTPPQTAVAHNTTPQQQHQEQQLEQQQGQQQLQQQEQEQLQQQEQEQQPQPTVKRGRPQKVTGHYSKGYSTIKKYRQRKKDMVRNSFCCCCCFRFWWLLFAICRWRASCYHPLCPCCGLPAAVAAMPLSCRYHAAGGVAVVMLVLTHCQIPRNLPHLSIAECLQVIGNTVLCVNGHEKRPWRI